MLRKILLLSLVLSGTPQNNISAQNNPFYRTVVFYVNGVDNDPRSAELSRDKLEQELQKRIRQNYTESACPKVELAYNTNELFILDLFEAYHQIVAIEDTSPFWLTWAQRIVPQDAFTQSVIEVWGKTLLENFISDRDLDLHSASYEQKIKSGNNIVVVGHSQGNLYANLAYNRLSALQRQSISLIAVSSPLSFVAGNGPYVTLEEDFIASNIFKRINASRLPPNMTNNSGGLFCISNLLCHSFVSSYLGGSVSGPWLLDQIIAAASTSPTEGWAKIYSTDGGASDIQPSSDGFIAAGWTKSFGAGSSDMWILKLDNLGNSVWQRTYGGVGRDEVFRLQTTSDGGLIAIGLSNSFGAGQHAPLVLKLDSLGNIQWQKTYLGSGRDWGNTIKQTSDGGYIIAGATDQAGERPAVLKLDAEGNIQWQKTYGSGCANTNDILQTPDGGYILLARSCAFGAGANDIWIIKLDTSGNIQWQKTYGGGGNDSPGTIQKTADGGYILVGNTSSFGAGGQDAWLLKLNADGSVAWQRAYGGVGDESAVYVEQTSAGGFIVSGSTRTFALTGQDLWVINLDASGNILWQRSYDSGAPEDEARAAHQTFDGGFAIAGFTDPGCSGCGASPAPDNFTVLKLMPDGSVGGSCSIGIGKSTQAFAYTTAATVQGAPATSSPGNFNVIPISATTFLTTLQGTTLCSSSQP